MKRTSILICDEDREYTRSMVEYLVGWESANNFDGVIEHCSDPEEFEHLKGSYDLALMGDCFIRALCNTPGRLRIKKLICLSEEKYEKEDEDFFYKYQSMEALTCIVRYEARKKVMLSDSEISKANRVTCVFSTGQSELSMGFCLSLCKEKSERSEVIFMDISELSILTRVTGVYFEKDMVDLIYMLENKMDTGEWSGFICEYDGFSILAPPKSPSQLAYVTGEQWKELIKYLSERGYKRIVINLGTFVQGADDLMTSADEMLVVENPGEYGQMAGEIFRDHLSGIGVERSKNIRLPPLQQGSIRGAASMNGLINGNMLDFVRRELARSNG